MEKKAELVYPGSFLSTAEESGPGRNVYEDEQGDIFSDCVGTQFFNESTHETSVKKITKTVKPLSMGAEVIGVVTSVKDKMVMLELIEAQKNGEPLMLLTRFASIPIFEVSENYVRTLEGMFRIGDIVKGKVCKLTPYAIDISTKGKEYGIIKGFDVKTREPLYLVSGKLKCISTGEVYSRKVSSDYILK